MFFTQTFCVNCFSWSQWELDLVQRSDWFSLSLLAAGVQLMNTWPEGCSEWANSLAGHLVSNATFMNLLLAQRWPRRQQWHSTSRFRASLCFGVCKLRSHNVLKDNKQCSFIVFAWRAVQWCSTTGLGPKTQWRRANTWFSEIKKPLMKINHNKSSDSVQNYTMLLCFSFSRQL